MTSDDNLADYCTPEHAAELTMLKFTSPEGWEILELARRKAGPPPSERPRKHIRQCHSSELHAPLSREQWTMFLLFCAWSFEDLSP